jgi:flagella basal body P-ring formation protein FlgA
VTYLSLIRAGLLAALCSAATARAATDPALISAAAEAAVRAQAGAGAELLSLEVAPLDPRVHLATCSVPLEGFVTDGSALQYQTTVGVRCAGAIRWTIYRVVKVESQAAVLVARRSLPRDAQLTAADFQLETRRVPGIIGAYLTDPATLAGEQLRRPVAAGEALTLEALAPANLIHRGQEVVLLARAGGLEVRVAGVALADGRALDRIRVQNLSSQRIVEGIVRSNSEVEILL